MTEEEARAALFADVSRETADRLLGYHSGLLKWQKTVNLVSPASVQQAWHRHFLDSAQVFTARGQHSGHWLDLGSGGGFPGLVVAILAADEAPDIRVTLVESDVRKCGFLREMARQAGVSVTILPQRIEEIAPQNADVISARALASLGKLVTLAEQHLAKDGICLFAKGAQHAEELATLPPEWQTRAERIPSRTDVDAVILRLRRP